MIPHQIYCDYLEDKGVDTRLFRLMERESLIVTGCPQEIYHNPFIRANGDGIGTSLEYDASSGYGDGLETWNYGTGDGDGWGDGGLVTGDGHGGGHGGGFGG